MNNWHKKISTFLLCLSLLIAGLLPDTVQAVTPDHPLQPRWVSPKPAQAQISEGQSQEAIEVKFVAGTSYRLRDGQLMTLDGGDLSGIQSVLRDHPVQSIERLFTQPEEEIEADKLVLEEESGEAIPDLNLWYRMTIAPGTEIEALVDALNALPEVEIAYPAPLPAPLDSYGAVPLSRLAAQPEPPTPNFVSQQGYLNPARGGIDAKYAWTKGGGNGSKVTIVDIEYSFNKHHEDLKSAPVIGGVMYNGYGDDHGTAVQGELIGVKNSYGVTGIAYGAGIKFSSPCMNSGCTNYNPANAINTARTATTAGDVILIEQQYWVCGTGYYGPLEWIQSVYDAIKVATTAKRIVVEAAGNGNMNLDGAGCSNKFKRSVRDSGAIIVGAGAPPGYPQTDRSRLYFSSYGSRVDVQGWGENVATTGYGDLYTGSGKNQWYTGYFSGTSSASPVVAGAAALLSSISRQRGMVQTPVWIRSTLVATGSPQRAAPGYPVSQHIGPRPDLKKAIAQLERPTPLSPSGTITDRTPTYTWTKVPGATKYQIVVYQGTTQVYNGVFTSAVCATSTCSATPGHVLNYAAHKWRARAYIGAWKSYSAYKNFTVSH